MTKIKNTVAYPFDNDIDENDFLIGSDANTPGKITKSYRMRELSKFFSSMIGQSGLGYVFSIYADENNMIPPAGYFFSENNSTTMVEPNEITYLRFNKLNSNGVDCSKFFEFLVEEESFDIKISSVSDPNKFFFFEYGEIEVFEDYFRVPVTLSSSPEESSLVLDKTYSLEVISKGGSGGIVSVIAGENVSVDNSDPSNPIVSVPNLGTSAFTDSDDYATAEQGALADSSIQPNSNISLLNNDANFLSDTEIQVLLQAYILLNEKGVINGVATLDANGKVPLAQINDALLGNVNYQGIYNASTNSPDLTMVRPKGQYFIVGTAGTQFGISFEVGDWIISNGTSYNKVDNTDSVVSVAGLTGVITVENLRTALDNVTNLSIQNAQGVEQFKVTDSLKFEGVSFSALDKKLAIDPLVPLSAFLDIVNGNDATATIENAKKPFKTMSALFNSLPPTAGETYTIYMTGGTIPVTRKLQLRNLRWVSYTPATLDFTNCMENDGTTHATSVFVFVNTLYNWTFDNDNISIVCDYVGTKYLNTTVNNLTPVMRGSINNYNWKSLAVNSNSGLLHLNAGSNLTINNLFDTSQAQSTILGDGINYDVYIKKLNVQNSGKSLGMSGRAVIDNIVKVGTSTFTFRIGRNEQTASVVLRDVTLENCTLQIHTANCTFAGTFSPNTAIDLVNINVVSGTLNSTLYPSNVNVNNQQVFRNYIGKLNDIKVQNGSVTFENSIVNCNTNLIQKIAENISPITFRGSNTIIQNITTGDLFTAQGSLTNKSIPVIEQGSTKTNALSYGINVNTTYTANTFKEKKNEIVIRSKKDIANRALDSSMNYIIDGVIDLLATDRIIVPLGGLSISGYGFDVSSIKATSPNSIIFTSPTGGCGNLFMSNISIEASGTNSKVFELTNAGAPTGGADAIELNVVNFDNCTSLGTLTNFRQGLWDNIGIFGVKDGITLAGVWSGGFRSDLVIVRNFGTADVTSTLFKAGTDLSFGSRFWTDINADFKNSGSLSNFTSANFAKPKLYQIKGAQITRNGTIDGTQNYTGTITAFDTVSDWQGNNGIANSRLVIPNAVNANEAVSFGQISNSIVTSDSTLALSSTSFSNFYTFTGTTATYTLPTVASSTNKRIIIINAGSGNITVNSNAGGNDIWDAGMDVASSTLMNTLTITLFCDGVKWRMID